MKSWSLGCLRALRVSLLVAGFALVAAVLPGSAAAGSGCGHGSTLAIVAHEDDSILFMNPDLLHDIQAGRCVRTVVVTAGDDGLSQSYWSSREQGAEAAYASLAGVPNQWTQSDAGISGHPIPMLTLNGNPRVALMFMRLPDGNQNGSGFPANHFESLQKLYTGAIPQITAVDGSSSYTKQGLTSTLTALMNEFHPDRIDTQDYVDKYGDGDHSDHHSVAYFVRDAHRVYTSHSHILVGYMDYPAVNQPLNVSGSDFTSKHNAWSAYTPFDSHVCQTDSECQQTSYWTWLQTQYTVGSEPGGPAFNYPPIANAGANQTVTAGSAVQLDGSGSSDPYGSPVYQWTQTSGPVVTLSSSTSATATFTAPNYATSLSFQLVVSDGLRVSQTSAVTIGVMPANNIAPQATVTASSESTGAGEQAIKAVDGVIDGYPNDPTAEWATLGGGAGSWLNLAYTTPQTINEVILYDRPNLNDQITGATLTFSDGSTVNVPALNNDSSATTVTFPAVTTTSVLMTVTSVSSTTRNIGLAEIQVYPAPTSVTADAGSSQTVAASSQVQLDGSNSYDPQGNPTYSWVQTAGPTVTLSSPTSATPTFTAPSGPATLSFQLTVTDGQQTSVPALVTVTVPGVAPDVAGAASVRASSQNTATGQLAVKAVDGVIDTNTSGAGTGEWASVGGGAGTWLSLSWPGSQTIDTVVLYDRPDPQNQITTATLTLSNGATFTNNTIVPVPALNNNGIANVITFPPVIARSMVLTVRRVSSATQNVGLNEVQVYPAASGTLGPTRAVPKTLGRPARRVRLSAAVRKSA